MTSMSQSTRARWRGGAADGLANAAGAASSLQRAAWHAVCILLGSGPGCFYVWPLSESYVNQPPTVVFPETQPAEVVVRGPTAVLSVRVLDPEGDPVFVDWPDLDDVPHEAPLPIVQGALRGSLVEVTDTTRLPSSVRALISDGTPDNLVTVRFVVVQP
jgi:hypothetical protein